MTINVVYVWELDVPEGEAPVEWILLTTEPVTTADQVVRIVDWYRARWLIEEYFKALKTGCSYEKRQLASMHALRNALALFAPIAWRLLLLRSEARERPDEPAASILTDDNLEVLRQVARKPLPPEPTVRDPLLAIAGLGGHLKRNGEPGWLTIARGYARLMTLTFGWNMRKCAERCDQS